VIARETSNVTYLENRLRSNLIYVIYIASEILRKVLRKKKGKSRNLKWLLLFQKIILLNTLQIHINI